MKIKREDLLEVRPDSEEMEMSVGGFTAEQKFKSVNPINIILKDPLIITATISGEITADVGGNPTTLRIERDVDSYNTIFISKFACEVVSITEVHSAAASASLDILNCAPGVAKSSGDSMLVSAFSTNTTADTPQEKTGSDLNSYRTVAKGNRIVWKLSTGANVSGVHITMVLKPIGRGSYRV